jgi:hypothetical protein
MAIDKALLDQLLAGREPQELFAKGGLIDDLKKALSERMLAADRVANLHCTPDPQLHGLCVLEGQKGDCWGAAQRLPRRKCRSWPGRPGGL